MQMILTDEFKNRGLKQLLTLPLGATAATQISPTQ
jgi:hypothetical protein